MNLRDFRADAERFRDIDDAALAKIEADDAMTYKAARGRWPDGLSVRAWNELMARGQVRPAAGVAYCPPRATEPGKSLDQRPDGPFLSGDGYGGERM